MNNRPGPPATTIDPSLTSDAPTSPNLNVMNAKNSNFGEQNWKKSIDRLV